MKKKLILMCIAGALVMTAVIGGTLAGFNKSTEQEETKINVNSLKIDVSDKSETDNVNTDELGRIIISESAMPGGTIVVAREVKNAGNYPIYVRVTINKKWDDSSLSANSIQLDLNDENWITMPTSNPEQIILYYKKQVTSGNKVDIPLTGITFGAGLTNEYANKSFEIAITTDAVQAVQGENAQVAQDAMLSEWGVYPVIEKGVIVGIEE